MRIQQSFCNYLELRTQSIKMNEYPIDYRFGMGKHAKVIEEAAISSTSRGKPTSKIRTEEEWISVVSEKVSVNINTYQIRTCMSGGGLKCIPFVLEMI